MKTKPITKRTNTETTEYINDSIREWYLLFAEDYPKNRELVLEIFDEGAERSPNPRIRKFWENLKNGFLEAEKTF